MRVVIGSDHAGFEQKQRLAQHLASRVRRHRRRHHDGEESVDYPDFADPAAQATSPPATPISACWCAAPASAWRSPPTRCDGVRAANVTDPEFARLAREHNNANVVTVSARFVPTQVNEEIVDVFLATPFGGGRHASRVAKIEAAAESRRGDEGSTAQPSGWAQ